MHKEKNSHQSKTFFVYISAITPTNLFVNIAIILLLLFFSLFLLECRTLFRCLMVSGFLSIRLIIHYLINYRILLFFSLQWLLFMKNWTFLLFLPMSPPLQKYFFSTPGFYFLNFAHSNFHTFSNTPFLTSQDVSKLGYFNF